MQAITRKYFSQDVHVRENANGDESRTIAGYAIVFNEPSLPLWEDEGSVAREVIAPEAVTQKLLDASDIKFTMYHDRQLLLARSNKGAGSLSYGIDERGVWFEFDAPKTPNGEEALVMVRRGDIAGCSFAFSTRYGDSACVERSTKIVGDRQEVTYTVRHITGIYDMTLATDPAYEQTSVEAREYEPKETPAEGNAEKVRAQVRELRELANAKIY